MKNLPFVNEKFELYDIDSFEKVINSSAFKIKKVLKASNEFLNKISERVVRSYTTVVPIKKKENKRP